MKRLLVVGLMALLSCNKGEEAKPRPAIAGEWEHLFAFLDPITITADSLIIGSARSSYSQLNDSILITNRNGTVREANYRLFANGELYFSYARSYNVNPLKIGRDSVVYEIYRRE